MTTEKTTSRCNFLQRPRSRCNFLQRAVVGFAHVCARRKISIFETGSSSNVFQQLIEFLQRVVYCALIFCDSFFLPTHFMNELMK